MGHDDLERICAISFSLTPHIQSSFPIYFLNVSLIHPLSSILNQFNTILAKNHSKNLKTSLQRCHFCLPQPIKQVLQSVLTKCKSEVCSKPSTGLCAVLWIQSQILNLAVQQLAWSIPCASLQLYLRPSPLHSLNQGPSAIQLQRGHCCCILWSWAVG